VDGENAAVDWTSLALLAAVTFAGAGVQAAFGFGFAILAAPLFLVVMDSTSAVPVLAVLNLGASAVVAAGLWRKAPARLLALLCLGSAAGFPLGLALFSSAGVAELKLAVGFIIMLFALLLLARERGYLAYVPASAGAADGLAAPRSTTLPFVVGFISGTMGAALAMPGPAAMLYLSTLRLGKEESRALSLTLFTFSYAAVTALHAWAGTFGSGGYALSLGLLAVVALGAWAGHLVQRHISEAAFRQWVLFILFLAGFYAVLSAN
jgi:uncharacterized membrane protein YfcA